FNAEFDNIVYFVDSYIHDKYRAKDIAQEALLTLWQKRSTINPDKNIRALLYTIARNKTINELKSPPLNYKSVSLDEIKTDILALSDNSLDAEIEALSLKELIEKTIDNLPDTVRESFIMSRVLGMTNREIAKKKKMSLTGVEYHMKISLKIFKEKLKEYSFLWGWILTFLY
ncbi:MAG: sigma-70 family RNA polymerase sigma factor, partial [Methanomicrobium sp.]|nr:sigma-70 family RNA polymerase sigma factor [Methanomicrobium sp.]